MRITPLARFRKVVPQHIQSPTMRKKWGDPMRVTRSSMYATKLPYRQAKNLAADKIMEMG